MSKKPLNIFGWIAHIIKDKKDYREFTVEEWKVYDVYMVNKFLSQNPEYVELIDMLQNITSNKEKHYRMLSNLIPYNSRTYHPYIKSKTAKLNVEQLKYISTLHECSLQEAHEYVELMDDEWLKNELEKFDLEQKQIKKIMKVKSKK